MALLLMNNYGVWQIIACTMCIVVALLSALLVGIVEKRSIALLFENIRLQAQIETMETSRDAGQKETRACPESVKKTRGEPRDALLNDKNKLRMQDDDKSIASYRSDWPQP